MLGSKNIQCTQKNIEEMMHELGSRANRAYKSSLETFNKLHDDILPFLKAEFEERLRMNWRRAGKRR